MATVTLEKIEAKQNELEQLIAKFKAEAKTTFGLPEFEIELAHGEHYAGIILGKNGEPSHHVILLPGEAESVNWKDAKAFAEKAGGELPTRREQSLLYANPKEEFSNNWYWSGEEHASASGCAWGQVFLNGTQGYYGKGSNLRARAVRRLEIQ